MMRKLLPTLLLAVSIPTFVMAAPTTDSNTHDNNTHQYKKGGHRMGKGSHGGMGMMKDLNLTQEQKNKMRDAMHQGMKQQHEIRAKYFDKLPEADKKAMQAELDKSREDSKQAIRQILTPEQQKKFDELKQEQNNTHKTHQSNTSHQKATNHI